MKKLVVQVSMLAECGLNEAEIEEASISSTRETVTVTISRKRREFGAPYKFSDKDSQELWNSSQMECRPFKDPNFELKRLEREVGVQAIPETTERPIQATNNLLRAGTSQYEPRFMTAEASKEGRTPAVTPLWYSVVRVKAARPP